MFPFSFSSLFLLLFLDLGFFLFNSITYLVVFSCNSLWDFYVSSTSLAVFTFSSLRTCTCLAVFSCNSLRDFCASSLRASTCLAVFSCYSFRDFCVSSLRASTCLAVFSCISLSKLLMYILKSSTTIKRYDFKSESCLSGFWGIQDVLWWAYWILMMPGVLGFC